MTGQPSGVEWLPDGRTVLTSMRVWASAGVDGALAAYYRIRSTYVSFTA